MNKKKSQTIRIIETYITVIVLLTALTLIFSGISISKINTDYMETGVKAGKIVAERENTEISLTTHNGITLSAENNLNIMNNILSFLPPPINTSYLIFQEISKNVFTKPQNTTK